MCRNFCDNDEPHTGDLSTCSISTTCVEKSCCNDIESSHQVDPKLGSRCLELHGPGDSIYRQANPASLRIKDIEEGLPQLEHVTLRFQGSNCPGCVTKISIALDRMKHIHNAHINAILMQINLDIDPEQSSVSDVIEMLQKLTGWPCHRVENGQQQLEILMPGRGGRLSNFTLPQGVKDMNRTKKDAYRVHYDATIIGARQLLKALSIHSETTATLLPPTLQNEIPSDIRMLAYKTSLSFALTCPILVFSWAPLPANPITYGAISLALASIIQIVIAGPFCVRALRTLVRSRQIDMDILIVLSTSVAYAFSVASFVCEVNHTRWSSGLYFETSALLISFIMAGRLMGDFACYRSMKSIQTKKLQPEMAFLTDGSNDQPEAKSEIDARLLQYGDIFLVKRDSPVVTDGKIVSGESEFDEGVVTGEASLVKRGCGATVIAGSVNRGRDVLVQLTRLPGQNTIDEIAGLAESVTHSKPKVQQIADRVAGWIVPAVGILALLTLGIWSLIGARIFQKPVGTAVLDAVPYTIAVLVVTCPCALILAVPIVLIVASSVAVRHGIIFRSAEALQVAKDITHVVFDKTGTLTDDQLSIVSEVYSCKPRSLTASLVLALMRQSEHPVSCAVAKHLESTGCAPTSITNVESVVGEGMKCMWNEQVIQIGNPRWLGVEEALSVRDLVSENLSVLCVTHNGLLTATYGLQATLRKDAASVISSLFSRGISISILSGDKTGPVHSVATTLKIPLKNTKARCNPLEKQQYIKHLVQKHGNRVFFCGDGINDAAALTQANLGLQICNHNTTAVGSLSQNAGNAILLTPSLSSILVLMDLSEAAHRQIVFSLSWAVVYNVFAILLAAGAFVKVRLPAEYAGLGEAVSVLPVVLLPLGLRWGRYGRMDTT